MISNIYSQSKYISVFHGRPYINLNYQSAAGSIRYNNNELEVFDGGSWQVCSQGASVSLSTEAVELLQWVEKLKEEKEKEKQLLDQYPGLRKAKERYELLLTLVKSET